jgi:hypothetical protein
MTTKKTAKKKSDSKTAKPAGTKQLAVNLPEVLMDDLDAWTAWEREQDPIRNASITKKDIVIRALADGVDRWKKKRDA